MVSCCVVRLDFRKFWEERLTTRITRSGSDEYIALDVVVVEVRHIFLSLKFLGEICVKSQKKPFQSEFGA